METTTINARIDKATKNRAVNILHSLGITTTQAICMFFKQIIYNGGIPFDIKVPNKHTLNAIKELEAGKGKSFDNVDDMIKDLNS